ncbi:uncharacterized protein LOC116614138 [Nematostella vectensis]|uniref:uncharacterized protein LOC116614138 n=1 Tax=Nematostella vectensis TaxID=45351 RepID=UPI0020777BAA|nr:uncharacterized protein LOC116614138 [Nematostella vectensis]
MLSGLVKTSILSVWVLTIHYTICKGIQWPAGSYGLPCTSSGCPQSTGVVWLTGTLYQPLYEYSKGSVPLHINASITRDGITRSFCIKNSTDSDTSRPNWPMGRYCIYAKGDECPHGMSMGSMYWNDRLAFVDPDYTRGELPRGVYTVNTLMYFCCSTAGRRDTAIPLPVATPFALFPLDPYCQKVIGAYASLEYIEFDTVNYDNIWKTPHPYLGRKSYDPTMYYCYYRACMHNLTATSGIIVSPNYPSLYPDLSDCRWTITVPPGHQIELDFQDFQLEWSPLSCDPISCSCDWLIVTIHGHVTYKTTYCNRILHQPPKILNTFANHVVLDFHSNGVNRDRGFKISYRTLQTSVLPTTDIPTTLISTTQLSSHNATTVTPTQATSVTHVITTNHVTRQPHLRSTTAPNNTADLNTTAQVIMPAAQDGVVFTLWLEILIAALSAFLLIAVIAAYGYWRFGKASERMREWLVIRYSSDASTLGFSKSSNRTINMYSGEDVEIITESQMSSNPLYGSQSQRSVRRSRTVTSHTDPPLTTVMSPAGSQGSSDLVYASAEITKESKNVLYQECQDGVEKKTENPLYERVL